MQSLTPPIESQAAESPLPLVNQGDILSELKGIRRALEAGRSEALGARDAAALCGVSKPTWDRMNSSGKVPRPVRLVGSVRWLRTELLDWLAAGCPDRAAWETGRPKPAKR